MAGSAAPVSAKVLQLSSEAMCQQASGLPEEQDSAFGGGSGDASRCRSHSEGAAAEAEAVAAT